MSLQIQVPGTVGVWLAEPKTQPKITKDCPINECPTSLKFFIMMGEDWFADR
jgi:hypothetical protein